MDETCRIEDLLARPFKFRAFSEQLKVVQEGRPRPAMPSPNSARGDVHDDKYDKVPWLTGSSKLAALFCWPCLLFAGEPTAWSTVGHRDVSSYRHPAREHERTESHIRAHLRLNTFGSVEVDHTLADVAAHNATARRNRDVLLRFLDCVFYVVKCGLPFDPVRYYDSDAEDEEGYVLGRGNYLGTLDLLAEFDPLLKSHLSRPGVFRERAVEIKDGLIRALATVLRGRVARELEAAPFAALLLDEVQTQDERLVCTSVRFVSPAGEIRERFVSARELDANRNRDVVFAHIARAVDELGAADKLVSYSHCGRTAFASEMSALRDKVRDKCPRATFAHDPRHDLQDVITGSLSHLRESRACVACLACVPRFFAESDERSESLRTFLEREYPDVAATAIADLKRRPLSTTLTLRKELLEYFDGLREESEDFRACSLAAGCVVTLESFEGCFHLAFLADVFAALDPVLVALETGARVSERQVESVCDDLVDRADARFEAAWEYATVEAEEEPEPPRKRAGAPETNPRSAYRLKYNRCLQNVVAQVRSRTDAVDSLGFVELLDPARFEGFASEFPEGLLRSADEAYPGCLDASRLRAELSALYSLDEARDTAGTRDLVLRMSSRGLDRVVPEAYRLGCLCLTVPGRGPGSDGDRLAGVRRCSREGDCSTDLATLKVETDLLMSLRETKEFRDDVVEEFATQAGMREFVIYTAATWTPDCVPSVPEPEPEPPVPRASKGVKPRGRPLVYTPALRATKKKPPAQTYRRAARASPQGVAAPSSPVSLVDIKEEPFTLWVDSGQLKMETDDLSAEFAFVEVSGGDPLSLDDDYKKE